MRHGFDIVKKESQPCKIIYINREEIIVKTKKRKILSVLLCISMLAAAEGIGGSSKLLVKAESLSEETQASMLVEKLGAGWSCVWNGASDIPNADFVEVVSTEQHNGNYALRIGHPEADTSFTLRRVVDVSEEGAYEWSAWLKRSGALEEGSAVYIKKGIDGVGGDIKGYSLAGQKDEEWFQVKNDNSATDMWINEGKPVCIEISVVCKAGTYLYLDDLNISKSGEANRAQLLTDGSFERWTCIRNEETAAAAEFLTQVKDEGSLTLDNTYLRIGNPDKATDLTLQLQAPIMAEDGNHALYTTCARIGGNGITEGSVIRIKDAIDAAGAGHVKEYPLHNLTSEWVWIDNSDDTTNNVWTTNCVIEIDVKCPAGGYLYLDDFVVLRNDNTSVYLNADSGFENIPLTLWMESEEPDNPENPENPDNPEVPQGAPEKLADYPENWERWGEDDDLSQMFITGSSHSGKGAFAFVNTKEHGGSLTQNVTGLTNGTYVLSAWVRSSGGQDSAAIVLKGFDKNDSGVQITMGVSRSDEWTQITREFDITSGQLLISLFNDAKEGKWMIFDDIVLCHKGETDNLLVNGDFEQYKDVPTFVLPPRVEVDGSGAVTGTSDNGASGAQSGNTPKTGDMSRNLEYLAAVMCVACAAVGALILMKRKRFRYR